MGGGAAVGAGLLLLAVGGPARSDSAVASGDPAHGAVVWVDAGCGACHAFAKAGSSGQKTGDAPDLEVEGELPRELNGTFYRNGPNPAYEPRGKYHWFDGDGMSHASTPRDARAA